MKWSLLLLVMVLSLAPSARAKNAISCSTSKWKSDRNVPLRSVSASLSKMPREDLIRLAWGEMLLPDQSHSMALPILRYLEGTAQASTLRGYFEVLAFSVVGHTELQRDLKSWPARPSGAHKTHLSLKEMCQLYRASL